MAKMLISTTLAGVTTEHELRLINIDKASIRDIVALQTESGMKMGEITSLGSTSEAFAVCVVAFLTRRNAGIFTPWDELFSGDISALGTIVQEPIDIAQKAEAEAEANPTVAAG
jgi:hypothetical protein